MSLIAPESEIVFQAMEALEKEFGKIDFVSERVLFNFTDYYAHEMGENLFRHFISFSPLLLRDRLPDIKLVTNRLEEQFATLEGHRRINIDPGYLSHGQVILATTKAYAHRPYLGKGIYADLTLIFRNQSFHPLDWTYPDYRQATTIALFNQMRKEYLQMIREGKGDLC